MHLLYITFVSPLIIAITRFKFLDSSAQLMVFFENLLADVTNVGPILGAENLLENMGCEHDGAYCCLTIGHCNYLKALDFRIRYVRSLIFVGSCKICFNCLGSSNNYYIK